MNRNRGILIVVLFCSAIFVGCKDTGKRSTIIVNEVERESNANSQQVVRKIYNNNNLVKAQVYRIFSLVEEARGYSNEEAINTILKKTNPQIFKSSNSVLTYKVSFEEILEKFDGEMMVHDIRVKNHSDKLIGLVALVHKKILGKSDLEEYQYLEIEAELVCSVGALPLFTKFNINEIASTEQPKSDFAFSGGHNRALSTLYYWMGLLEELEGRVMPFQELLDPDFQMNFSSGLQISSIDDMDSWLNSRSSLLADSKYDIFEMNISIMEEDQIVLSFGVDWNGITQDNNKMTARTSQHWLLRNDLGKDFPQIVKIDVEQIIPFTFVNS